jgi:hypothetical protein
MNDEFESATINLGNEGEDFGDKILLMREVISHALHQLTPNHTAFLEEGLDNNSLLRTDRDLEELGDIGGLTKDEILSLASIAQKLGGACATHIADLLLSPGQSREISPYEVWMDQLDKAYNSLLMQASYREAQTSLDTIKGLEHAEP